jgi:hypothetical protein
VTLAEENEVSDRAWEGFGEDVRFAWAETARDFAEKKIAEEAAARKRDALMRAVARRRKPQIASYEFRGMIERSRHGKSLPGPPPKPGVTSNETPECVSRPESALGRCVVGN